MTDRVTRSRLARPAPAMALAIAAPGGACADASSGMPGPSLAPN